MTRPSSLSLLFAGAALAVGGAFAVTGFNPMGSSVGVTAASAAAPAVARGADAAHPTVVELFESQGCSDCPPANANVNALAARPDILALNFAVTYWDQLGWKDTFAKPAYTARQWDYSNAAGRGQVATPQVIINGGATVVGANPQTLARAVQDNARGLGGPQIVAAKGKVTVGKGSGTATVWIVYYDPRTLTVPIRAGENAGRTLDHRNVVRSLAALGSWNGAPATFTVPAPSDRAYRSAILVQQGKGGKIIAASRI
ncbi:DUF1223 domain-containing protein [Sphingomonas sp.]|uniref:DUF1223 domain-containing protein n=1 Tax=Sphingomonas sp. TaxID=28214 RepID=UPI003341D080